MRGFEFYRSDGPRPGYQRHHLIPVEVICHTSFAPVITPLRSVGFNPRDFATNGVWLPASEKIAMETGQPLHRGPHPYYNQFVGDQVAFLNRTLGSASRDGLVALKRRLNHLQGDLRRALSRGDTDLWLNRRDPRENCAGFASFDDDLRQLSMAELLL